jgi:diaminopimelate decarboxylase
LLVGNAGILVCRVIYLKRGAARTFAVLDGAMNDLIRPAMYEAYHRILPVRQAAPDGPSQLVDLVGPICESTDTFATNRELPALAAGDRIVFCSAGAYGAVMASTYNTRPLVPEVMVRGGEFAVVRDRPSYDEMLALDRMPRWLSADAAGSRGAA